jgi:hypothetical protein
MVIDKEYYKYLTTPEHIYHPAHLYWRHFLIKIEFVRWPRYVSFTASVNGPWTETDTWKR